MGDDDILMLGNRIFIDANGDGIFDPGEGANGVALTLFADTNGNNILDEADAQVATATSAGVGANAGTYAFANLAAGSYIVRVDAVNFEDGHVLAGLGSTTGSADPDDDVDNDDNGVASSTLGEGGFVVSKAITLTHNGEITDGGSGSLDVNNTLDFGFFANTAPTLSGTAASAAITEASNAPGSGETNRATLFADLQAADANIAPGADFAGARVRISNNFQSGAAHQDYLRINGATSGTIAASGIVYSYDATTGVMTLTGAATADEYEAALQLVQFSASGDDITAGGAALNRTVSASIFDGEDYSSEVHNLVSVTGINDAPVNGVPGAQAGSEDGDLLFGAAYGNALSIADVDAASGEVSVTLGVEHGLLTLGTTSGLSSVTGNGTDSVSVTGSVSAINAALQGLTYRGDLNYQGSDTLTIVTNDQGLAGNDPGATGTGTTEEDSDQVAITLADDGTIDGDSGANHIVGTAGNDRFDLSQGGNDDVDAGDGRDVLYYGGALTAADANDGGHDGGDIRGDLLVIQGNYDLTFGADSLVDIEKLRTLKGVNDDFGYTGGGLFSYDITTVDANVVAGGRLVVQGGSLQLGEHLKFDGAAETDGSFQLFGGHDSDELIGGAQADHLLGRAGNDILTGNGGDDRLRGGLGGDTMGGGSGADIFVYNAQGGAEPYSNPALESTGTGYDTITGFDFASDRIDLPQTVSALAVIGEGALSNASFDADLAAAVDATLGVNGAVLFTANGGDLASKSFIVVDANGDGSYEANLDFVIQLVDATGTVPATPDFFL